MLDEYFKVLYKPNLLVPWYLLASYLYYHRDVSIISDGLFDWICQELDRMWGIIEHQHKYLIDQGHLTAGTGYALPFQIFPGRIIGAADQLQEMVEQ